jgi:agmatinase
MGSDHHHLHDHYGPEARYAVEREAELPTTRWDEEVARGLELGLPGADSIVDKRIPTFSRGELPHFAGINTFLKAPYVEDVRRCGEYDVAVLGAPFDGGATFRAGARHGPAGIREASLLLRPYNEALDVSPFAAVQVVDAGDAPAPPVGIERAHAAILESAGELHRAGARVLGLGGDHSVALPLVRAAAGGRCRCSSSTRTPTRETPTSARR